MNSQSLLEITGESHALLQRLLRLPLRGSAEDAEVEAALSPSELPFPPRAAERLGLTEMEGLLFDSAPTGLLIVSKWSPPATALIICDPGCVLGERGGDRDQQPCSSVV